MNALKKWVFEKEDGTMTSRGTKKMSGLADYLGVTQPCVTKMIQNGTYQDRKYARKIMEFTKIPAHELFPFWVDIFGYSEDVQNESLQVKRKQIQERMKLLQDELDVLYVDDNKNAKDIEEHLTSIGLKK